jgi:hypothetical protein
MIPASLPRSRNSAGSPGTTSSLQGVPAPSPRPTSATAPRVSSRCRRSAICTIRRPSSRLLPGRNGVGEGADADFFYFPAYEGKDLGSPVLGAGTLFAITKDSPGSHALIEFLQTPIAHEVWMAIPGQGFLTPLKTANLETYSDDTKRARRHPDFGAPPSASTAPT